MTYIIYSQYYIKRRKSKQKQEVSIEKMGKGIKPGGKESSDISTTYQDGNSIFENLVQQQT